MPPKITLYSAHYCPWAHRSQIALREIGLQFETVLIDLSVPRTPEYLAVNPRGLVPALRYDDNTLIESGLIAQFLVDAHPSHLLKASSEPGGALQRYQIGFFVDTYFSKVSSLWWGAITATTDEAREAAGVKFTDAIEKEIEPLLATAAPFFGGSSRLTLAEVQTGSFILRVLSFPNHEALAAPSILKTLETKTPNFWKWAQAVTAEKSVTSVWDEQSVVNSTRALIKKLAAKSQ